MAHQEESANYYRLITLAVDVGPDVLRDVLLNLIHPNTVATVLQGNMNNLNVLKSKRILFQDQYDLLTKLPAPDLEELDITLLTFIFRNICNVAPVKGWLIKPAVNDISLGADLWRLKDIRNNVFAHATSTNITSVVFRQTWTELSAAIIRISQHGSRHKQQDVVQRIRNLEHQDLDPSSQTNKAAEIFLKWKEHDDKQKLLEEQDAKQVEILHVLTDLRDKVSDAKLDKILHDLTDLREKLSDAKQDEILHVMTDRDKVSDAKLDEIYNLLTDVNAKVSIKDNDSAAKDRIESDDRIADMTVVSTISVGVCLQGETRAIIRGFVFLSDKLLMCDWKNANIKLLNCSFTAEDSRLKHNQPSVYLERRLPWDIKAVSSTTAIISLPANCQLQFVEVMPWLQLGDIIQLDKKCWGVEVVGKEIYISCHGSSDDHDHDSEVRVCDMAGNLRRRIGAPGDQTSSYMFRCPDYLTVSSVTGNIYVSDSFTNTVTCLSSDGSIIYEYSDPELRGPAGLYVDAADNVIVCGYYSDNLQMITASGKKHRTMLTQRDGIECPRSVAYRHSDTTLVVGCRDSGKLFAFKLSH